MARKLLGILIAGLMLLGAVACGGGQGLDQPVPDDGRPPDFAQLPGLSELPVDGLARKRVSDAAYDLLLVEPQLTSPYPGSQHEEGQLTLDADLGGGLAWAVYALPGFPTDGSILPLSVIVEKGMPTVWVGLSNFARGSWQFMEYKNSGGIMVDNGADLISEGGVVYAAVLGASDLVVVTRLRMVVTADLPPAPVPVINVPEFIYEGHEALFNAVGSSGGDGEITELVWTMDMAERQSTTDPTDDVAYTLATPGQHIVGLVVKNDMPLATSGQKQIEVLPLVRELLIVYNSDMPDDLDLVEYYSSPLTGRAIHPDYRLGLELGADAAQTISREDYGTDIRDPIIAFLDDPANAEIKSNVKYLLMMKGVPYKIPGTNGGDHNLSTNSCLDAELCLLRSGGVTSAEGYRLEGPIWNGSNYHEWNKNGFYYADDLDFAPDTYQVMDLDGQNWPLNYLVGRISAYTYDDCKAMIDRSLAADTSGLGWIILDSKPGSLVYERMFDPVWPNSEDDWNSGYEMLSGAGFNIIGDTTSERIIRGHADCPTEAADNMFVYCSWGKHSGFASTYILDTLGFTYLPGACFMSYESFNGTTMRCSNPADPSEGHPGQGQIADFIFMGGTCAIGNVYEPWTDGVGDERWVFHRYMEKGDPWIEAAYKGLCYVSWQEVVLGDPLCRVVAE